MTENETYQARLSEWSRARFSPPPEPELKPIKPTLVEKVTMRDGVRLYTEIFLPVATGDKSGAGSDVFPVILSRSPYPFGCPSRHDTRSISRYTEAGYAVVFQLTRGQGQSEGEFHFFKDDAEDGYDCIEWLAKQLWCNGNVGMEGSSYLGNTQLLAARTKPAALKCIMPTAFIGNCTRLFPFSNGVPSKAGYMQWHQVVDAERWDDMDLAYGDMNALGHPKWGEALHKRPLIDAANDVLSGDKLANWKATIANPLDNEFWESVHFTDDQLAALDLPMFFTDGWYDMTVGPINYFTRLEKIRPGKNQDSYLLIGPWNHQQTYMNSQPEEFDGERVLPENAAADLTAMRIAFFDRYLKNLVDTKIQEDRVRVFITGASNSEANIWKSLPTFPAPSTEYKAFYLHSKGGANTSFSDGILKWESPTSDLAYQAAYKATDQYTYDPSLPTDFETVSSQDRREVEIRTDVLTYTSEPLVEALTILGEIKLELYASSTAQDTDWFVVATEVFPNGRSVSFYYAPPAFRARYRQGFDKEVLLKPDKPEKYDLSLGIAGHQIAPGNRLRLSIFSSAFPEYEPNSNSGNCVVLDRDIHIAKQTIYHSDRRPSHLILPIITS